MSTPYRLGQQFIARSTRFDLYALPAGGIAGKDEYPLHQEMNKLNVSRKIESIECSTWGGETEHVPVMERIEIDLVTMGNVPRENLARVGSEFHITMLDGYKPEAVSYKVLMVECNWQIPFHDCIEVYYKFLATKEYIGGYDVEVPYAWVQYDQGDGTFIEYPKTNKVKIDTLLNNRYNGW